MPESLASTAAPRERFVLAGPGVPSIALQVQRCTTAPKGDVLYVHGATFGADLSVFFPFDGRSWADALTDAGWNAWGFDFAGFGGSDRYPADLSRPAGAIDEALQDLERAVAAVQDRNGGKPVVLLAHSRGCAVAARLAGAQPAQVRGLVLFAPIVARPPPAAAKTVQHASLPSHYPVSAWAQYRRFVEDVPRGQPQVLAEAHMHAWAECFLASDPTAAHRQPPAVLTPAGPLADIAALWSGQALYAPQRIQAPTLLVRGEWDALCTDADATRLFAELAAKIRTDVKITHATHLMHLESQRWELYNTVNGFLNGALA